MKKEMFLRKSRVGVIDLLSMSVIVTRRSISSDEKHNGCMSFFFRVIVIGDLRCKSMFSNWLILRHICISLREVLSANISNDSVFEVIFIVVGFVGII